MCVGHKDARGRSRLNVLKKHNFVNDVYFRWLCSVMVSTWDFDSHNPGSIPGMTFIFFFAVMVTTI